MNPKMIKENWTLGYTLDVHAECSAIKTDKNVNGIYTLAITRTRRR